MGDMTVVNEYIVPATTLQRTYNNTTPAVINYYNVMFTAVHIPMSVLGIILYISSGGIPAYICVIYPMRGNVHRRVYMREKGWGQFIARTRSYTPDCIYLYLFIDVAHI